MPQAPNRICYVEDEPDIRSIADFALTQLGGFTVDLCDSGQQAIDKASAFAPDLFLLDVMMPVTDGIETFKRLKELPALQATPIVFDGEGHAPGDQALFVDGRRGRHRQALRPDHATRSTSHDLGSHPPRERGLGSLAARGGPHGAERSTIAAGRKQCANDAGSAPRLVAGAPWLSPPEERGTLEFDLGELVPVRRLEGVLNLLRQCVGHREDLGDGTVGDLATVGDLDLHAHADREQIAARQVVKYVRLAGVDGQYRLTGPINVAERGDGGADGAGGGRTYDAVGVDVLELGDRSVPASARALSRDDSSSLEPPTPAHRPWRHHREALAYEKKAYPIFRLISSQRPRQLSSGGQRSMRLIFEPSRVRLYIRPF